MKVRVELTLCVGHGRCYALAPDIFEDDERGYCTLLLESVPPDFEKQARMAEANCPEGAITADED